MNLKKLLAIALCLASIGSISVTANATTYADPYGNGVLYVKEWNNYTYDSDKSVTLRDYRNEFPTFSQNQDGDWVSDPVTVTSSASYYETPFFSVNFIYNGMNADSDVDIYDHSTGEKITNNKVYNGQKIYIVSKHNPFNLEIKFALTTDYLI